MTYRALDIHAHFRTGERKVLAEHSPHAVLIPATGRGRDYGPRTAGELELGMTADCVGGDIAKAGRPLERRAPLQ